MRTLKLDHRNAREGYSDITWKVKVDVPSFDGKIDAITFSDWLGTMEDYFDWYEMSNIEWAQFAKMKLVGPARKFWHTVMSHFERLRQLPINQWEVMKDRLKEKYLPAFYRTHLVDQMLDLRQSNNALEELIQLCELVEDPSFTIAWFIRGLRPDLKLDVILSSPFTWDEAYHKALEVDKFNKLVLLRCPTFQLGLPPKLLLRHHNFRWVLLMQRPLALRLPLTHPCLLVLPEPQLIRPCSVLVVRGKVIMLLSASIARLP